MALRTLSLLIAAVGVVAGADIPVGGPNPDAQWTTGLAYAPVNATVGDVLVFTYSRGQHNVVQVGAPDCSFINATEVAGLTATPFRFSLNKTGTFHFACSVSGHCDEGMLLAVNVAEPPPPGAAPLPAPVSLATRKPPPQVNDGRCDPPVLVPGTNDTYRRVCLSPGIPLAPGQVINDYYTLANPYPSRVVAIINQTSQIVDETGRPVPLSEVYCHHFFGNGRLVLGEGAELRGSLLREPLPEPYFYFVNGTYFDPPVNRRQNLHLINTVGVDQKDLLPCVECWCRNTDLAKQNNYYGGTACCSPLNCVTPKGNEAPKVYYLQYNVSYRLPERILNPIQAQPYLLDVVNGSVEYDVFKSDTGKEDVKIFTAPLDARCPQKAPYGVLRCTGHLHIGGDCMEMYDTATDQLICRSCAVYGNSTSPDTPGEEKGYVVRLTDDTLDPPYMLKPGQDITIVSHYDSTENHYGVMALWLLSVTGWDPTCPGDPTGAASAASSKQFDIFSTFTGPASSAVPDVAI